MRSLLFIVVLVVLAVIGGIAFILFNLDALVKEAVEKIGSEMTQTAVTLQDVNIDPANGKASLSGLKIGNPQGFKTDHALALGMISLAMDPATVTSDVVVINEIIIDSPSVIYEIGQGSSNIEMIHQNIMGFADKSQNQIASDTGGNEGATAEAPSEVASEGPQMIIQNIYLRDIMTAVSLDVLGGKPMELPALNLHLKDIGKKEEGVLASEAATQIMDGLLKAVITSVVSDPGKLLKGVLDKVDPEDIKQNLQDKANEAAEGIKKDLGGVLKNIFGGSN